MTITKEQALAWAREAGFSMIGGVTDYVNLNSLEYFAELIEQHVRRETQPEPPEALCPRPVNGRPDNTTASECIAAGECGCDERDIRELVEALRETVPFIQAYPSGGQMWPEPVLNRVYALLAKVEGTA